MQPIYNYINNEANVYDQLQTKSLHVINANYTQIVLLFYGAWERAKCEIMKKFFL